MQTSLKSHELRAFWEYFSDRPEFDTGSFIVLCEDIDDATALKILVHFRESLQEAQRHVEGGLSTGDIGEMWHACERVAGPAELLGFKTYAELSRNLSHRLQEDRPLANHSQDLAEFLQKTKFLTDQILKLCPKVTRNPE